MPNRQPNKERNPGQRLRPFINRTDQQLDRQ